MLDWYGQRITDTASFAMMTIPFNVAATILSALGEKRDAMRLVDVPRADVKAARNRGKLAFSNGAILGKSIKGQSAGATKSPCKVERDETRKDTEKQVKRLWTSQAS
jgi:hypothetical protein